MLLNQVISLIRLLHSETGRYQIAAGIAAGFVLGMTPVFSLQTILIFSCILFFRVQFGMAMLSAAFFKIFAYALDPIFNWVGSKVLGFDTFAQVFTWMYNAPIIPYTRFNNTIVMGAGVVSLALAPVVFFVSALIVKEYRVVIVEKLKQTRVAKWILYSKFYQWYVKASSLRHEVTW